MFSPVVPKELNFEKFYKGAWQLNFTREMNSKVNEIRRSIHDVGMSAPGFFKNLLKNIANPFYHKEYVYKDNGSFGFVIPYDDYGNSLRNIFSEKFGTFEVSSFSLYGAPHFQESTYISTIVYINGRPLTDEKFMVLRQYSVDIVIIPNVYLEDNDNVFIEQRRYWNKPRYHKVDKSKLIINENKGEFTISDEYIFDASELGTFYSADNGYTEESKSTINPSMSRGEKILNKGDYLLYYRALNNVVHTNNVNGSVEWKLVPKDLYSISKVTDPNRDTKLLRLNFNVNGYKSFVYDDYNETFGTLKKKDSNEKFFGYLYPTLMDFIEENEFVITNNSAQWEINIYPEDVPDPTSPSAVVTSKIISDVGEKVDNLVAYYPYYDNFLDYSTNQNHIAPYEKTNSSIKVRGNTQNFGVKFSRNRTLNGEYDPTVAAEFDGQSFQLIDDFKYFDDVELKYKRITNKYSFTAWICPFDYWHSTGTNSDTIPLFDKSKDSGIVSNKERAMSFAFKKQYDNNGNYNDYCEVGVGGQVFRVRITTESFPLKNIWTFVGLTVSYVETDEKEYIPTKNIYINKAYYLIKVYVNGDLVGETNLDRDLNDANATKFFKEYNEFEDENYPLYIGCDLTERGADLTEYYKGLMRQARFFSIDLDQSKIIEIMNSDGSKNGPNYLTGYEIPVSDNFNFIPLKINSELGEFEDGIDHAELKGRYIDFEEYDKRVFNIRIFSDEFLSEDNDNYPLPVSCAEELLVLVNENKTYDSNLKAYKENQAKVELLTSQYKNNFIKVFFKVKSEIEDIELEANSNAFIKIKVYFDELLNNSLEEIEKAFDFNYKQAIKAYITKCENEFHSGGYADGENFIEIDKDITYKQYLESKGLIFNTKTLQYEVDSANSERIKQEVINYVIKLYGSEIEYNAEKDTFSIITGGILYKECLNKAKAKYNIEGLKLSSEIIDEYTELKVTDKKVSELFTKYNANGNEMAFLEYYGWYFDRNKEEWFRRPDYVEPTFDSEVGKSDWYKLIPYVDYCLEESDGKPLSIKFFRNLPNSASVKIVKLEPKSWFFFDAFFKTLSSDGIVVLDKYFDLPIDKAYLDCTINNQNVEKSLLSNISDKAVHINAFDATNLAYFRMAIPKNLDTLHFIENYESFKTDFERYIDILGLYHDPTDINEKYTINQIKAVECRVHPTISPSVYDYPTRDAIYQDDMIYGHLKAPGFRVVRYCDDEMCKYNQYQGLEYIGRHLEHDDTYVHSKADENTLKEYSCFDRLADNTNRIPASEFRIVFEDGMLEYNELCADIMRTTDSDGSYLIVKENPSKEGFDVRNNLLYIKDDGTFVFSKTDLNTVEKDYIEVQKEDYLEETEQEYNIKASSSSEKFETIEVTPPSPVIDNNTGKVKVFNVNGSFNPITLYDYANSIRSFQRYITDESIRKDPNEYGGFRIQPFNWTINGSVFTTDSDKVSGSRSLLFLGSYNENNIKLDSYIYTDIENLALTDEYKGTEFTKDSYQNGACCDISFWIKPEIKSKGEAVGLVSDDEGYFVIYIDKDGYISCKCTVADLFNHSTTSYLKLRTKYNLYDGKWHHIMLQIKHFGNIGKRLLLGLDGDCISNVIDEYDSVQFIKFSSSHLNIGKGFNIKISSSDLEEVYLEGNSYRGYMDSFCFMRLDKTETENNDFLNSSCEYVNNIPVFSYTIPNGYTSKDKFYSILSFNDSEWTNVDQRVVYDPSLQTKSDNYGHVIAREFRVIGNEIYEAGRYTLEVPALYFKNMHDDIL